jgi:hypothetical protein
MMGILAPLMQSGVPELMCGFRGLEQASQPFLYEDPLWYVHPVQVAVAVQYWQHPFQSVTLATVYVWPLPPQTPTATIVLLQQSKSLDPISILAEAWLNRLNRRSVLSPRSQLSRRICQNGVRVRFMRGVEAKS